MRKLSSITLGITILLISCVALTTQKAQAETISSIGIATYLQITGKAEDGDIITSTPRGYTQTSVPYDSGIVGVVTSKPAIALRSNNQQKGTAVVNVGSVLVKVVGINGGIKKGDPITSSAIKGTGMKAIRTGYILGESIEDATFASEKEVKTISVNLSLHFLQVGSPVTSSFWQIFNLSSIAAYEEPLSVFKYVISAIVLIISFGVGFAIFSRTINTGLEAIGRNPLAGRMIQLSILFNVVLVIIIIMTGIGIVWLFLRI